MSDKDDKAEIIEEAWKQIEEDSEFEDSIYHQAEQELKEKLKERGVTIEMNGHRALNYNDGKEREYLDGDDIRDMILNGGLFFCFDNKNLILSANLDSCGLCGRLMEFQHIDGEITKKS
jgi:hypothetical protein